MVDYEKVTYTKKTQSKNISLSQMIKITTFNLQIFNQSLKTFNSHIFVNKCDKQFSSSLYSV